MTTPTDAGAQGVTPEMVERAVLSFITEMSRAMDPRSCLRPVVPKVEKKEMEILRTVLRASLVAALNPPAMDAPREGK
jgi:hypothetical protein